VKYPIWELATSACSLYTAESRNRRDDLARLGQAVQGWLGGNVISMQGSGLPSLIQSRLNAPRILKMGKVSLYVISKLEATEETRFVAHEHYYKPQRQADEVSWPPFPFPIDLPTFIVLEELALPESLEWEWEASISCSNVAMGSAVLCYSHHQQLMFLQVPQPLWKFQHVYSQICLSVLLRQRAAVRAAVCPYILG